MREAVLDDLVDRDHRDAVLLGEQLEEREAGGRAVVVQHLADHRDRRQPGEPARSTAASVWPRRSSTPPSRARNGNT